MYKPWVFATNHLIALLLLTINHRYGRSAICFPRVSKNDFPVPKYLNVSGLFKSKYQDKGELIYNLYLSSGDTDSPLHHDGYANLLTVLDGRKEVHLIFV